MSEPKAGRELDARVAERVLGYEWRRGTRRGEPPIKWLLSPEQREYFTFGNDAPQGDEHVAGDYDRHVPRLSTDIAAAFLVVEKMRADGWRFSLDDSGSDGQTWEAWFCRDWSGESWAVAVYEERATMEHAICLAALQAVAALHEGPNG